MQSHVSLLASLHDVDAEEGSLPEARKSLVGGEGGGWMK